MIDLTGKSAIVTGGGSGIGKGIGRILALSSFEKGGGIRSKSQLVPNM